MIKLWNSSQVNLLKQLNPLLVDRKLPEEIICAVKDTIDILDQFYGSDRDPDKELGGYICIQENGIISESEDYNKLLAKYGTSVEMAEFTEPIKIHSDESDKLKQEYQWYLQVYILSSDFTLTIIYKDIF